MSKLKNFLVTVCKNHVYQVEVQAFSREDLGKTYENFTEKSTNFNSRMSPYDIKKLQYPELYGSPLEIVGDLLEIEEEVEF